MTFDETNIFTVVFEAADADIEVVVEAYGDE